MPSIPPSLFARPCTDQPPQRLPESRLDSTQRGYTRRWKKYRAAYLAQHPLCRHCLDRERSTLATVIDHIIPVSDDGERDPNFWPSSNHQPLCVRCHARKTAQDRAKGLTR